MTTHLSKSKIMSGLQCEKRLWLETHRPALAVVSADVKHRLEAGDEVNEVARSLHAGGHLIGFDGGIKGAVAETKRMLKNSPQTPLFEATFSHQDVVVRVDVLKKGRRGYRLIEVKSGSSVKDPYYPDCAVQAWALEGCGVPVELVEVAYIDTSFVYAGDGDYRGLLTHENVTKDIADAKQETPGWVKRFKAMLKQGEPDIATGRHCKTPYACPFIAHCSAASGADYPVTDLPGGSAIAEELRAEGIADIRDIPRGRLHNARQEWVRKVTVSGQAELNPAAKQIVDACAYPRYYLDFETIQFAVPQWKDTRPYQALPFQWSCHIERAPGEMTHAEFLHTTNDSPMRAFIDSLLAALGDRGAIFVYSGFEKTRLNELAACFPDLRDDIRRVNERLVDLFPVARANYYHPDMRGSWSLKALLPTIAPQLDYADLGEVQDGGAAGIAFLEMIGPQTDASRARQLAVDLRAYCERDTEALVELVQFFSAEKQD
ncbi:MAG: DUF2779 domain-containing protein [Gammaproteobacteria bacterium]|nr:DUF2779 domain-containing protein [Gammaproteobacteria bacterium]